MTPDEAVETLEQWLADEGCHPPARSPYRAVCVTLEEVERLRAEREETNEALAACQAQGGGLLTEVERLRARINKALKAAPKDPDRAALCNLPGYIRAMVRALKGGEE